MEKREFGSTLRKLREQAGLNQRELAEKVGVNFSYLSKLENGVMPPPSQELILKLANVLRADKDELLTLAGKVPADIAQILKNRGVLQSLREGDIARKAGSVNKNDSFAKKLRELREAAGLSQSELAENVGVSFTYLSKIENGVRPPPSEKVILKLAEALKYNKDDLMALAGKVPSDIARILKNREVRQSLRESQTKRTIISASSSGEGVNIMKHLMNSRSLVRIALAFVLVFAVAASLWYSSPSTVKALMIEITNPTGGTLQLGTIGQVYNFQTKITIEDAELLPINNINLSIFNSANPTGYRATLDELPLVNGDSENYSTEETGGGAANVTAVTNNLVVKYGAGNVTWQSIGYPFPTGYGYGAFTGNATITYNVAWLPPVGWPIGTYTITANITAPDITFTQAGNFNLQTGLLAETGISQALSSNVTGVVVIKANIDRIKNPADNVTATIPGGIGSYAATISGAPSNAIKFVAVYGVPPFNGPSFDNITGVFAVPFVAAPQQAVNSTVAEVVPVLIGSATTSVSLTINFQAIGAASQPGLYVPGESPVTIILKRGDADKNGVISVVDSLAIKQYLVAQLTLSQINPLNAASPNHDGASGDKISVVDALAVEQYLVSQINSYYQ